METSQTLKPGMMTMTNRSRIGGLILLIAVSDYLIFGHDLGLNLFLFAIGSSAVVIALSRKRLTLLKRSSLLGISIVGSMPLLEVASPLSMALSLCSLMGIALICAGLSPRRWTQFHLVLARFAIALPLPFAKLCRRHLLSSRHGSSLLTVGRSIGLWLLPLALASVFLVLFTIANPLIEQTICNIDFNLILGLLDIWRLGYWLLVAAGIWAMLRPRLARRNAGSAWSGNSTTVVANPLISQASLLRSLLVFNVLFAVQSSLDIVYLWSGADLPDGLTHAEYAHRGAYPLIATALLAGAFVLFTMKRGGPGDKSPLIRGLVFAWIAQNILLCLSSMLRLDLYVEAYSLTGMRIAAGIWMCLVAIGLALILLRIILRYSNEWLVAVNFATLACILYASTLTDFPALIARFNVLHSREVGSEGVMLDLDYIASLGPSSIPALDLYMTRLMSTGSVYGVKYQAGHLRNVLALEVEQRPTDWRSWSYRASRLESYLHSPATIATLQENEHNGSRQFSQDR